MTTSEHSDFAPAGSGARPRTPPRFIGRRSERAWLERCAATAREGKPVVAHIVGEPGIGKTRLLREFYAVAESHRMQIAMGRGYEGFTVPLFAFAEALVPVVRARMSELEAELGPATEILRDFLRGAAQAPDPSADRLGGESRLRMFLTISEAVLRLARMQPMVLAIDDLHWVDQASLDLLTHLICAAADRASQEEIPLLVLTTLRPVAPGDPHAAAIARCQREEICQTHTLRGLTEIEAAELVETMVAERPSHQLVTTVSEVTGGNPLFLQEVVFELVKRGHVTRWTTAAPSSSSMLEVRLPADVTAAIAGRIRELRPPCRVLLEHAACIGEPFTQAVLCAVARCSREDAALLLDDALNHALIQRDENAYRFDHPLVRQVLYQQAPLELRQESHGRAADALEKQAADPAQLRVVEIAHHLIAAGASVKPERVLELARAAGEQAFANGSWKDAARFYRAALGAAQSLPSLPIRVRAELHYLAGLAHFRDQDAALCIEQFELAVAAYRSTDDLRGLICALAGHARARFTLVSVAYGTLIDPEPLKTALARLGNSDPQLTGFVWAELAQIYWTARKPSLAVETAERAVEIAERVNDDSLCAEAYRALALAQGQTMQIRESATSMERGLAHARRTGDAWLESHLVQRVPLALFLLGRLEDVDAAAAAAADLTRRTHDWGDHSLAQGMLASLSLARGRFADTEEHARLTIKMRNRSGYPWAAPIALSALARARVLHGSLEDADDALAILVQPGAVFEDPGPLIHGMAFAMRTVVGAYADVSEAAHSTLRERFGGGVITLAPEDTTDAYSLGVCCAMVELAMLIGDAQLAVAVSAPIKLGVERGVVLSTGWVCLLARVLGLVALLDRDWDRAEAWFEEAIARGHALGVLPEVALAHRDYAALEIERGGDRSRALALYEKSVRMYAELGMAGPALTATRIVEALGVSPAPSPAAASSQMVQEVWQLRTRGRTDAEIAQELLISPKTVASYARLGGEAAAASQPMGTGAVTGEPRSQAATAERTTQRREPVRVILFTDVVGSTALLEAVGDEQGRRLIAEHDDAVATMLARFGGTKVKHTGDGMVAWFRSVTAAIECAIGVQQHLAERNARLGGWSIAVHIGISAGEPLVEGDDVFGAAVHEAARICARARGGEILVADVVRYLAHGKDISFIDRGRALLKGQLRRVRLFEVSWHTATAARPRREKED